MSPPGRARPRDRMHRASVQRLGLALLSGAAGLCRQRRCRSARSRRWCPAGSSRCRVAMLFGPWLSARGGAPSARSRSPAATLTVFLRHPPDRGADCRRLHAPRQIAARRPAGSSGARRALSLVAAPSIYGVGYLRADDPGRSRMQTDAERPGRGGHRRSPRQRAPLRSWLSRQAAAPNAGA